MLRYIYIMNQFSKLCKIRIINKILLLYSLIYILKINNIIIKNIKIYIY
jgi:hypothetical protein